MAVIGMKDAKKKNSKDDEAADDAKKVLEAMEAKGDDTCVFC